MCKKKKKGKPDIRSKETLTKYSKNKKIRKIWGDLDKKNHILLNQIFHFGSILWFTLRILSFFLKYQTLHIKT